MPDAPSDDQLIALPEVCQMIGLHRGTVYRLTKSGDFPAGVKLTAKSVRWWRSEVRAWLRDRPRSGGQEVRAESRVLPSLDPKKTPDKSAA